MKQKTTYSTLVEAYRANDEIRLQQAQAQQSIRREASRVRHPDPLIAATAQANLNSLNKQIDDLLIARNNVEAEISRLRAIADHRTEKLAAIRATAAALLASGRLSLVESIDAATELEDYLQTKFS